MDGTFPDMSGEYDVYDTSIHYDDGVYYRFATKNRLYVQTSESLHGPWSTAVALPDSKIDENAKIGSTGLEAPTAYQLADGSWMLLGDNFRRYVGFHAENLRDFAEGQYELLELVYPASELGPRYKHGTILSISEAEYEALMDTYGEERSSGNGSSSSVNAKPSVQITGKGSVSYSSNNTVITLNPEQGWIIESVSVNGVSKGAVNKLTGLSANDKVAVIFVEGSEQTSSKFIDISGHWAEEDINRASELGLFDGTGNNRFSPNIAVNRAMIVQVLYRMAGEPVVSGQGKVFEDVPDEAWYSDAVVWASANGIVTGFDEKTFGPLKEITREQLAVMLYRYASFMKYEIESTDSLGVFADAGDVSQWAKEAMAWAVSNQLINGNNNAVLDPQDGATRAECATIMVRFAEHF